MPQDETNRTILQRIMITYYYKRALKDILNHRFLNTITIITIALSILIASAFVLFFVNAGDVIDSWKKGIRIMAYLKPGVSDKAILNVEQRLHAMPGVQASTFVPKDHALSQLKEQMRRQSSLFDNLRENPLPDAFEIRVALSYQSVAVMEDIATTIESFSAVDEVEYGQRWLGQFTNVMNLFKLAGYALIVLFCIAALFIVANTIRLILYSRREEIEVMRLVGATDRFIKIPFYVQGLIQGALGGIGGLFVLFVSFTFITSNIAQGLASGLSRIRFLSPFFLVAIFFCSMVVGWLGSFLSLKQFLKS